MFTKSFAAAVVVLSSAVGMAAPMKKAISPAPAPVSAKAPQAAGSGNNSVAALGTFFGSSVISKVRPSLSVFYSAADQFDIKGFSANHDGAPKYKSADSDSGPGLSLQAEKMFTTRIGIFGGADYEFNRQVKNIRTDGSKDEFGTKPVFSMLSLNVNLKYNVTQKLYGFAGLNQSYPDFKNLGMSFSGKLGYQAGAGILFTDNVAGEIAYRRMNLKLSNEDASYSKVDLSGVAAQARYYF